ncbi:MAG: Re/Si-specific NAD(P)(+) transhydrogenase subunit alpha [Alphaproteobacteria bacterium]|nr:Re/Si-specific NAD(P)(+) transhydrogenase subunit alpha [Alphaproteobacteria bacterium]
MKMKLSTVINPNEKRVAITPETAAKYIKLGLNVVLPKGVGESAGFADSEYEACGAVITESDINDVNLYVCVKPVLSENMELSKGSYLIAMLSPFQNEEVLKKLFLRGINPCALEKIPRITRAQSMDILSSQANIAGYRAVIEAMSEYCRVIPLMMTAAGTVRPARILVLGAGVAGLQAIATAKRMGARVSAFDVRRAAKEQVESLGASFVDVESDENGETVGGYAREMSEDYKKKQAEKLKEALKKSDIVISTAQIQGKPAPRLITKEMVYGMAAGSVIVDMATETGGNCELSKRDQKVVVNGVTIVGYTDFAGRVAYDSSQLFARNVFNFVSLMLKDNKLDTSDEIIQATLIN